MDVNNTVTVSENGEPNDQQGINVKEIFFKYLHYWWVFALFLTLSLLIGWLYLRYTNSVYSVSSTLLIKNDKETGKAGEDMFADIALFQPNSNKQNEIEILRSRSMMERVAKQLNINTAYFALGKVKTSQMYPNSPIMVNFLSVKDSLNPLTLDLHVYDERTFSFGLNQQKYFFGQIINRPEGVIKVSYLPSTVYPINEFKDFRVQWMPLSVAGVYYSRDLEIQQPNEQSSVLLLKYNTENVSLGADILNVLMDEYSKAAIEDKNEINKKIINFINDRLDLVETQLGGVERDLESFKTRRDVIDLQAQSGLYFNNLSELQQAIREQEVQLQVVNLLENYLRSAESRNNLVPSTLGIQDPTLLALVTGYNELVQQRSLQLQTGATPTNPIVLNLDKSIEESRSKMLVNLANIRAAFSKTLGTLKSRLSAFQGEISSIPSKERENREIARQQEIKQSLYLYLLQKKEESSIAVASAISNSRVLDNALPVYNKIKPRPARVIVLALLAGLALPIGLIFIVDLLNDKVTTRNEIRKLIQVPIVGEIGHNSEDGILVFPSHSRSVIAEQFRILRSNFSFMLGGKTDKPVFMVTSSFSGEGKSFVSTNVAASLALSGKKTAILEFDLRKPKIMDSLGLKKGIGFTNYLVGGAQLEDLPHPVPGVERLFIVPSGPVPPNPAELLMSAKLKELITYLKANFDALVIDTAPVGLVSDAMILSEYADACLYVVRQRYTYKKQLAFLDELYKQKKLPSLGVVVNDVLSEGSKGYYGYGAGRYGYGYGYGYATEGKTGVWSVVAKSFRLKK